MALAIEIERPPLTEDDTGAIRVGSSRVLLELVVRAFQDGASAETIVQNYSSLTLSEIYLTIGYFLRHQREIEAYLQQRENLADEVRQRIASIQPDLKQIRNRILAQKSQVTNNAEISE